MSILIDELLDSKIERNNHVEIDGYWYILKGMELRGLAPDLKRFKNRFKDAVRVFKGKSFAVHYKEDDSKVKQFIIDTSADKSTETKQGTVEVHDNNAQPSENDLIDATKKFVDENAPNQEELQAIILDK